MITNPRVPVTEKEAIDLLRQVIAVKCEPELGILEPDLVALYASIMRDFGMEVQVFEAEKGRPNVIGRARGSGGGKSILFNGHLMCPVSNVGDWRCDPYATVVEDGKIYAMGVADLKAAAVAMMLAGREAVQNRWKGDVVIGLGAGGELGGWIGTKAIIERVKVDAAVVGEPSELDITYCQRGAVWTEFSVKGVTGLTGRPGTVNAAHKAVNLAKALIDLNAMIGLRQHPLVGCGQLSVNLIEGGTQFYNVPDRCTLKVDRRLVPAETLDMAVSEIEGVVQQVRVADPEMDFTFEYRNKIPPVETSLEAPILKEAQAVIAEVRGRPAALKGMFGFTEMAHIHKAGVQAIICGPGSPSVIHAPNEYVEVQEFIQSIAVYTELARRITN